MLKEISKLISPLLNQHPQRETKPRYSYFLFIKTPEIVFFVPLPRERIIILIKRYPSFSLPLQSRGTQTSLCQYQNVLQVLFFG